MPDRIDSLQINEPAYKTLWLPVLVGTLLCTLVLVLWWALTLEEHSNLRNKVKVETEYHATQIEADLRNRTLSLQRIVQIWEFHKGMTKEEFVTYAGSHLSDVPGIQALAWVDTNYTVQWIVPFEGNEKTLNLNVAFEKNRRLAMEKARESRSATVTMPVDLVQGENGFLVFFPIFVGNEFNGYIKAIFRIQEWLNFIFTTTDQKVSSEQCRLLVTFDDQVIYKQAEWDNLQKYDFAITTSVQLMDHTLHIYVRPTTAFVNNSKTIYPVLTAVFGILLSILISFIVYLFQKTYLQTWRTHLVKTARQAEILERQRVDRELQKALARIDMATKAGKMGVWTWDVSTRKLTWNERMFDLLNMPSDIIPTYEIWRDAIHPDDVQQTETLLKNAIDGKVIFDTEFRLVLSDGSTRNIRSAARVERNPDGTPLFVTGVTWDITEHRQVEQALKHQSEMQKIIMEISSQSINIPSSEAADAIQHALKRMGEFVAADRTYVFEYDFINNQASNTYEWCKNGITQQIDTLQKIPLDIFYTWIAIHKKGEPISIPDVAVMPESTLKMLLERQDIKSLVTVPLVRGKELTGFVGFDSVKTYRTYTSSELAILNTFSQTLVNIRARLHSESALQESEAKIRLLLNSTGEAIYGIDLQGNCTFSNPSCARLLGYPDINSILGKNMHRLIHHSYPDGKTMTVENCRIYRAFRECKSEHVDNEVLWKADGTSFPAEYWSYPQIVNGQVSGAVVTFIDITERKQVDDALKQTRQNYETFFNTINEFLFVIDNKGHIIHTNSTVIDRLGYTQEELSGTSFSMLYPAERREETGRIVDEMLLGITEFCPVPIVTKSGVQIPVETRIKKGIWNNKPVIFGVAKDISRIQLSEEKFSKAFHINPSASSLSDLNNHTYIEVNDAFYSLLGFDKNEVIGKTAFELDIFTLDTINTILGKADTNGKVTNAEAALKAKNGEIKQVLLSAENISVQNQWYRYTVIHDITMQKQAQEEREKLIVKLEEALSDVNKLSGMLPICSSCKRIRDDKGYWNQIESYIKEHSEAEFTHGICPECAAKLYPDYYNEKK